MQSILGQYPFYTDCSPESRCGFLAESVLVHRDEGRELVRRGGVCEQVFLVGEGSVRVYSLGQSGREISLYHVHAGQCCPHNVLSALLGTTSLVHAQVDRRLRAIAIPAAYFRRCLTHDPALQHYLLGMLSDHFAAALGLVEQMCFDTLEQRVAGFLLRQLDQHGREQPVLSMTHERIASELGSVREVVSRILRRFQRRGVISMKRGRIQVIDVKALRDERRLHSST